MRAAHDQRYAGPALHQHQLRRAPEFEHAHEHAPLHSAHQCVLQEVRESYLLARPVPHAPYFVRIHQTLRTTPAIAAGISQKAWTVADIVALADIKLPLAA